MFQGVPETMFRQGKRGKTIMSFKSRDPSLASGLKERMRGRGSNRRTIRGRGAANKRAQVLKLTDSKELGKTLRILSLLAKPIQQARNLWRKKRKSRQPAETVHYAR